MITVPAGTHKGTISDYGMSKTQKDKPQIFIRFDLAEGKKLTWFGGLDAVASDPSKRAPLEMTVKTLLDCGFSGDAIENLAAGKDSNLLQIGLERDLVVKDNHYNGDVTSQIAFINDPNYVPGFAKMTAEDASKVTNTGSLRAELMRQRKQKTTSTVVPKSPL